MKEQPVLRLAQVFLVSIVSEATGALLEIKANDTYSERIHSRLDEIERLLKLVRFNLQEPK